MSSDSRLQSSRLVQSLLMAAAALACLWTIWLSATFGVSRLLTRYAVAMDHLPAVDESVRLGYDDAETHFARGEILKVRGSLVQAVEEFERAAALRPQDYFLWVELGLTRDEAGDQGGAFAAFNEAVRLAPYYAQPAWQRGNLQLRAGRYDDAFNDLRAAAKSNPDLLPNVMDLAWGVSKHDAGVAEQLLQITNSKDRVAFALFLARQRDPRAALQQFFGAGSVTDDQRREVVQQLNATGAFPEAFMVWKTGAGGHPGNSVNIYDGGFEGALRLEEGGFGWRVSPGPAGVNLSLDESKPQSGAKSLRVDFNGNSNPGSPLLSQLVPVNGAQTYRISFAARTRDLVTAGLPLVVVDEAGGEHRRLAQSPPLVRGSRDWYIVSFQFATTATTNTIVISLQRESCSMPCPIFGNLWLDSFSIAPAR